MKPKIKLINAKTFKQKLFGLLSFKELKQNEVMVIRKCSSIHTFFMKFTIDVIFTDKKGSILKLKKELTPWRICYGPLTAREVYEAKTGFINKTGLKIGDNIKEVLTK